jgi:hypothetical protein
LRKQKNRQRNRSRSQEITLFLDPLATSLKWLQAGRQITTEAFHNPEADENQYGRFSEAFGFPFSAEVR